jgi:hypothetical protein
MIKKFTLLFLSAFLCCATLVDAQNKLVLKKESQIHLLKRINSIEITGTVVNPTKKNSRLTNAILNIYADSVFLFSDSTNEIGDYYLLFSLKNICADSIYIKVTNSEFSEFITAVVPFENNAFDFSKEYIVRGECQRTHCGIIESSKEKITFDTNNFSSGRVFKREDFQYIPKKD